MLYSCLVSCYIICHISDLSVEPWSEIQLLFGFAWDSRNVWIDPFKGRLTCPVGARLQMPSPSWDTPPASPTGCSSLGRVLLFHIAHPQSWRLPGVSTAILGTQGACEVGQCFLSGLPSASPGATSTVECWGRILLGWPELSVSVHCRWRSRLASAAMAGRLSLASTAPPWWHS